MDDYIGGRYSSTSAVGGAVLSLAFGPEVFAQFLDGAAEADKLAAEALAEAKVLAKEIEEKQLVLKMKVGEGGRTFGSISTKEIAAEAKKQLGYDLDKKKMHCEPIKNLGFHDVTIKVHPQVTATLRVKVEEK